MRAALHHLLEERAHTHEGDAPRSPSAEILEVTPSSGTRSPVRSRPGGARCPGDDRVAVFLDKRLETVESIFGVSAAGGVFVPVNPLLLKPQQVAYILDDCGVRVLVTTAERLALLAPRSWRARLSNASSWSTTTLRGDGGTNVPLPTRGPR